MHSATAHSLWSQVGCHVYGVRVLCYSLSCAGWVRQHITHPCVVGGTITACVTLERPAQRWVTTGYFCSCLAWYISYLHTASKIFYAIFKIFFYYQVLQCLGHLPVLIYYYSPSISVFLFSNLRSLFVWAILRVQASFGLPHFFRPLGIYSYVFFNLIHRFKPI